jgi:hypothetical protein
VSIVFIGSINRHMRSVLETAAAGWKGQPVYVACSGNFTVERILARCGVGPIHSNDVSIYSCALGWYLAGKPVRYELRSDEFDWLRGSLEPGAATVATLLLVGQMLTAGQGTAYAARIVDGYRRRWPELHAATVARVTKAAQGLAIANYYAGDCRDFLAQADPGGVCVTFPPTYRGGYERLYKRLESLFEWPKPEYAMFGPEDVEPFSRTVRSFRHWMISSDLPHPEMVANHVATVQTSLRSKPVFMYSDSAPPRVAAARQSIGKNPWAPHTGPISEPPQVVRIDAPTMNAIRSLYLNPGITVCDAPRNYAVLSGGKLVGAFAVMLPRGHLPCDIYLLSDFPVRPNPHRRLSKLVLACAVGREVRDDLEQWLCSRIRTVGTTAFTDKPVSMKYRGLFEVHNRSEGKVNYLGPAGRWTLAEGYAWWIKHHSAK